MSAALGMMFFIYTVLVMLTGIAPNLKSDNARSWLVTAIAGIVGFLGSLVSINVHYHKFLGCKTFDDNLEGQTNKAMEIVERSRQSREGQRAWRESLKNWARRMWRGDYP